MIDLSRRADGVFEYVPDPHGYFLGQEELPSPSSVFAELGLVYAKNYDKTSRSRGRAVHAGICFALKGTLDWATLAPELHGYVHSGLLFVERRRPKIKRLETSLYHPALHFAGTYDAEWELDAWDWIVDWKTGKAPKVTRYQTAAYAMMAARLGVVRPHKRAALELQEDGSMANLVPYNDHTDGAAWLNLLGAYRIRRALRAPQIEVLPQGD